GALTLAPPFPPARQARCHIWGGPPFGDLLGQRNRAQGSKVSAADQGDRHERRMPEEAIQTEGEGGERDQRDGKQESNRRQSAHVGVNMPANRGAPAIPEAAHAFRGSELCRMLPRALPRTGEAPIGLLKNASNPAFSEIGWHLL